MTRKKILKKIDRIVNNAEYMYNISGDYENGRVYHAYGEGGFPIRLSYRQAKEVADYLSDCGFSYWLDEIKIDPKAVYRLWVKIKPHSWLSSNYEYSWGFRRLTESPYDTIEEGEDRPSRRRSRRERAAINMP